MTRQTCSSEINKESFSTLMKKIRACEACKDDLPLGPRPIVQAHEDARLLIVGQAPGIRVHRSGIPWDDASGERLRDWMGISRDVFYDKKIVAIVPMGFCYPGTGERGDLPPRKECFSLWHERLIARMPRLKAVLLLGSYAHASYLKGGRKASLTETVRAWKEYLPRYIPLPHPSPLNNIWLHKNRWFEASELPQLKKIIQSAL
jgi:uracil-DNA glycosylase